MTDAKPDNAQQATIVAPEPVVIVDVEDEATMTCLARLNQERLAWRKKHPHGFFARPQKSADGSMNATIWEVGIPGPTKTPWVGGTLKLRLEFPTTYPEHPPKCIFSPVPPHPNVYPSGRVCNALLAENENWSPLLTVTDILLIIQAMFAEPNPTSPAQFEPFETYTQNRDLYDANAKSFVEKHAQNAD